MFCVTTCFHTRIPNLCLSDCPLPEKGNHPGLVNVSFTLVIDTSIEKSSQVATAWKPKNLIFFFKKVLTCAKSQNHLSFINIPSTLVIYTSMERSSRVLQHGNLKIWIFFKFWWPATDSMSPKLIAALIFLDRNMLTCFRCHILLAIFSFYNVCIDKYTSACYPYTFIYVSTYICVN